MRYIVAAEVQNTESVFSPYGVEIQPPLSELAAAGLCRALTHRRIKEEAEESGEEHFAEEAYVVRCDREGTALYLQPNPKLNIEAIDAMTVAQAIGYIIDPASKHEIVIEPDRSPTGAGS